MKIWYPPIEHGVESRNLVYPHRRHFQELRDIIHNADTRPPFVLSLSKVKERNHSCLLVLGWVTRNDFLGPLVIRSVEFERNLR
jgi:hypothetical protein